VTDRIVIVLADGRLLALEAEAYRAALEEGEKLPGAPAVARDPPDEPLLDAGQLAAALGIPESWIEAKGREGVIPSLEFGRWRRFRRSEVEAAVRGTPPRAA
jgi:excisionase family DNA binding protein